MRYISATQIFSGTKFFNYNSVIVLNDDGIVDSVVSTNEVEELEIEHFEGIITPGFVNAHCHLELSHLHQKINQHTGIVDFGLEVIKKRNVLSESEQIECMHQADKAMFDEGIVLVGDISNTAQSISVKKNSKIKYHTFVELIALNPQRAEEVFDKGRQVLTQFVLKDLTASLAPHAPYSVSAQLINYISHFCEDINQPTCIHNQESETENDFFLTKTGHYLKLYETLNLPIDFFKATAQSSLQSVLPFFVPDCATQFVHNSFSSLDDINKAQQHLKNTYWCLCPNANLYIENTLPPLDLLIESNSILTIGTDSLASNQGLSIINEINVLLKHFPNIKVETLLQAATYNGAKFLNQLQQYGSIEKNKRPGLNLLTKNDNEFLVKKII